MKLVLLVVHFQVVLLFRGVIAPAPTDEENTVRPKNIQRLPPADMEKSLKDSEKFMNDAKNGIPPTWGPDDPTDPAEREKKWDAIELTGCPEPLPIDPSKPKSDDILELKAKRTVIIIVDFQNDFSEDYEQATMKVAGSHRSLKNVITLLGNFKDKNGDYLIVTKDAHPESHFSFFTNWKGFKDNNGEEIRPCFAYSLVDKKSEVQVIQDNWIDILPIWPRHCVVDTPGFDLHPKLVPAIDTSAFVVTTVHKAVYPQRESFSGFVKYDEQEVKNRNYVNLWNTFEFIKNEVDNVLVVGLAFEYCVKATAIDAAKAIGLPKDETKRVIIVSDACGYMSKTDTPDRQTACSDLGIGHVKVMSSSSFKLV